MESVEVETYDQLLVFLNRKYGKAEELPVFAQIEVGTSNLVPHSYRLSDGREISIDIIFTPAGDRILDPEFDLDTLPD